MAGTSGCSRQLEELKLSEVSRAMDEASEADRATPSLCARGESIMERKKIEEFSTRKRSVEEQIERSKAHWSVLAEPEAIPEAHESDYVTAALAVGATTSPFMSAVEEQIERSKAHWSVLADPSSCVEGEEVAEVSNFEEFKALQRHPTWGSFFATFGYDLGVKRMGELEVGEKFAEGGQAEIYDAKVKWRNLECNELDCKEGIQHVLKVFKKGTFLKQLKSQWPPGLLQDHAESLINYESPTPRLLPRYFSYIVRATLLKNGRFAFLMRKDHFDLRTLIESNMKLRSSGPFSKEEVEFMMYRIALGVDWLHFRNIVHRDLKAANVLVRKSKHNTYHCYIADYECSNGVVGTGFFRAPEILQVCKEGKTSERPEVFSRGADVYSYGMTCYEILAGKLPFEDHPLSDNIALLTDLVINQHLRPEVPEYVEDWKHALLTRCWQHDPTARPTIGEILDLLSVNSTYVRGYEEILRKLP